jgi:hypothetical protein
MRENEMKIVFNSQEEKPMWNLRFIALLTGVFLLLSCTHDASDKTPAPNIPPKPKWDITQLRKEHISPSKLQQTLEWTHQWAWSIITDRTYQVKDPYRTAQEEMDAFRKWLAETNLRLLKSYGDDKVLLVRDTVTSVSYDGERQLARPRLSEPLAHMKLVDVEAKGLWYEAAGFLYDPFCYGNTLRKVQLDVGKMYSTRYEEHGPGRLGIERTVTCELSTNFSAPIDRLKARELNIVNATSCLDVAFILSHQANPIHPKKFVGDSCLTDSLFIPVITLYSMTWTLGGDTLWHWTKH